MTDDIRIDEDADWPSLGGSRFGGSPGSWNRDKAGKWKRSGLPPYGRVDEAYRARWYTCAECGAQLLPTNVRYRYGCVDCGVVFGSGFGGLWGYAPSHAKAMRLTDACSKLPDF